MAGPPNKRQKREDYRKAQETFDGTTGGKLELPKKKFYRQRAHANPFSDHALTYPATPAEMDWSIHFPAFVRSPAAAPQPGHTPPQPPQLNTPVQIVDIGCGFGGLLIALSPLFPSTLMVGMELRTQVLDYVTNRIAALRSQNQPTNPAQSSATDSSNPADLATTSSPFSLSAAAAPPPGAYQNISAVRTNTMKFLPNFFGRGQLTHVFVCFPDPHFKQRKHKARIVSAQLNAEYAFVLRPGGKLYTITDVEELHRWIVRHFEDAGDAGDGSELWRRVDDDELERDVCVRVMSHETEEAKKVTRNGGNKYIAVWARREDPPWHETSQGEVGK